MKLKELLNSCQNQWKGCFGTNKEFKVCLYGSNGHLKDLNADYVADNDYMNLYRDMKVSFWEFRYKDILVIELEY